MSRPVRWLVLLILLGSLGVVGWSTRDRWLPKRRHVAPPIVLTEYEAWVGATFTPAPTDPFRPPRIEPIRLPELSGANAIWWALGRSSDGRIWIGLSHEHGGERSARLMVYDPKALQGRIVGDVVGQLRHLGLLRPGEQQRKIHSRIVHGEDGHLYFTSMDDEGEAADGSRPPTWGGHLWRLRLPEEKWEHVTAAPEGLIAVASAGRWVYALGYFGHVLYQYDLRTGKVRSLRVGSVGGHISRNFFTDHRGHAFVPQLRPSGLVTLVGLAEIDPDLREVGWSPLVGYSTTPNDQSHGLIACQALADRSIMFLTDQGHLYRVTPEERSAKVEELGTFHPDGTAYVASLFALDDQSRYIAGLAHPGGKRKQYDWVVYDLRERKGRAQPVEVRVASGRVAPGLLLYGSMTRDAAGRFYVGGPYPSESGARAALLRVSVD